MKVIRMLLLSAGLAAALRPQQLQLNLDHLAAKASNTVDVSLNGSTLQFAAKFLDGNDPEEANVKKMLVGIQGIYVRSYEFKKEGGWSQADVDGVRNQLRGPQWSRIVGIKNTEDGKLAEVYVRTDNQKMTGLAIVTVEAKQLTVVNIVGAIDLDALSDLGGHFGVPKVEVPGKKK